ncbi:hypothetical protein [Streptomyces sp. NPDC086182]|uniref:hypothetical protein n=1 Tax=Streptomyces sp. NPDC086182 TaxID=3155058 RepID=UPI003416DCE3
MARFELTDADRYRIDQASKVLAEAGQPGLSGEARDRMYGRLQVVLGELLQVFGDEDGA